MGVRVCVSTCTAILGLAGPAAADLDSPAGLWKTIDDKSGKERALVRIVNNNGAFEGRVEKIFDRPGDDLEHLCRRCDGERKNKPIIGMTFMWGLKKNGDQYDGGEILDPNIGIIYRGRLRLKDGGRKLEVRGYIGLSLFGRSQTWLRQE
ncbi:MAG TPA: DUF2147 domain-containing protein [Burkholderiales bacterium]|nr:DUF2147 domain-containing protein [Burkholderiales bacterium]